MVFCGTWHHALGLVPKWAATSCPSAPSLRDDTVLPPSLQAGTSSSGSELGGTQVGPPSLPQHPLSPSNAKGRGWSSQMLQMKLLNISFRLNNSICLPLSGGPAAPSAFLINKVVSLAELPGLGQLPSSCSGRAGGRCLALGRKHRSQH